MRKLIRIRKFIKTAFNFVAPLRFEAARRMWGTTTYDQVSEEETESTYVYKMDQPRLTQEEVAVEIRWGRALWVLGQGDEAVKVKLRRSDRVKVSAVTASMSHDGVLTDVVTKWDQPRKWYKYKDLGLIRFKTVQITRCLSSKLGFHYVEPREGRRVWGIMAFNQVTEEETVAAFLYKMDRPWLNADELRVEIWQGNAMWVIGQGDETIKVELRRNHKMRVSEATASTSADGVLTVVIPKRYGPRKWYEFKALAFNKFKTFHIGISWS
ncbi:uncharacterized protein LOC115665593 [Syzygium oleosum]|uniref:uncharacterized protein LOC115665593 n=1 Tax=Syzygium oleosum TaxID=219896 RepID=UPI0024BB4D11|nr:uncharacterized protein LOC115665593 [Syzygium oleosum]